MLGLCLLSIHSAQWNKTKNITDRGIKLLLLLLLLYSWYTSKVMSGRSVNIITLFLGRLGPPKRLTSTSCTYFRQKLTTAPLESAEGETKVCGQTGYRTQDLRLTSQVPYRLRYAARLAGSNKSGFTVFVSGVWGLYQGFAGWKVKVPAIPKGFVSVCSKWLVHYTNVLQNIFLSNSIRSSSIV